MPKVPQSNPDELALPDVSVLMGVCGCGKTEVGLKLASLTGGVFYDGDDFHPEQNVLKMSRGEPLNDRDRVPWLERIRREAIAPDAPGPVFVGCSALKREYRERLTAELPEGRVCFVHLEGTKESILARMRARQGHFMKEQMVESQFETLEVPGPDERAVTVSVEPPVDQVARDVLEALAASMK